VGRPYEEIEKSLEMQILIAPNLATIRQRIQEMLALNPPEGDPDPALEAFLSGSSEVVPEALARSTIIGTPEQVREQVQAYVDAGINHFMFWFLDVPSPDGLHLFAEQVAPHFK
jgi:alkanesulfonate monooxygenase SsuD/methylene tetrahydromethanopterin reductase-like flavin-dependent oxidoreductase (luciferase family)